MNAAFDYVVVGGGSAGCVVASRLSEDPRTTVCLIEAGPPDKSMFIHMPAGFVTMVATKFNNWAFETVPQEGLAGRRGYQPRGKTMGGSSSINAMLYVRGHRWDYDHWASLGNAGWSYDEILPYFRKAENNEVYGDEFHGKGGPLNVKDPSFVCDVSRMFVDACNSAGIPTISDYNGAEQYGACVFQVTQKDGERCSAAKAYVTPNLSRPNLKVMTRAATRKVVLEGKRATGVLVQVDGRETLISARKEVVLSAGAFGSPQLLMLSGIGPGEHLQQMGLPVVKDLPGVGGNLQDHVDWIYAYHGPGNFDTFGLSISGGFRMAREFWKWQTKREGHLTSVICEAGAFIRSAPDVEIPDLQFVFVAAKEEDSGRKMHWGHGISGRVALLRPKSHGTVRLATPNPADSLLIDPKFFSDEEDLRVLTIGARRLINVMEQAPLNGPRGRPMYPVDPSNEGDLVRHIRKYADTQYHAVGTCKMGVDDLAVVDSRLRVWGIAGLRVVDASIMPKIVSGNTNAATIMIGEKAAEMIREGARASL